MNSLIVFAAIIAGAAASSVYLHQPAIAYAAAPVVVGGYKEHQIIPQPPLIKQYAKTEVVGVAPIEHGVTIKHYSAHPAGFGYSHRSYGINGNKASDSYVAQPPHSITKTVHVAAPAVAYHAAPLAYAGPGFIHH